MQAVQIDELELFDGWSQSDTGMRVRAGFPISSGTGTKSTAVVYFELEPGAHLGSHTDSAEEVLLVVSGSGEATIGDEQAAVRTGTLAVVPALVPHSVKNTGEKTLSVVGFFSSSTVLSIFDEPMEPFGTRYFSTPMIEEEAAVAAS
ncbi:MAG TPA: cupin domain-containing protein [Gaiellaceae bacterium]|jgi:quercetin dioxygenase-like cupin family protein